MHSFQIDPNLDVPIYKQLVDSISSSIRSSDLPAGTRLPTVRRLADQLGVANGTVKRAYDELEKEKLIEKSQGRGTFVSYLPESSDSRKVRAMAAIDQLFETLEELDFSMNEMGIFLNLKLQERARTQSNLRIAVVECNAEILSQLGEQLRKIEGVDIYPYLLDDIIAYPYKLGDDVDLIVTTQEHAQTLSAVVPDPHRIARIAVRPSTHCMSQIVKLKPSDRVGILCGSPRFGELLSGLCEIYTEGVDVSEPCLFSGEVDDYLADKTVVLVPENYDRWDEGKMSLSKRSCRLIPCSYRIDEGSFIYLEEKVQRLRERRKL
ncbi:MAG: GntR family transcriptional regulator [Anaerovoracaceae bacterium]|jgi:DNA-binding transcriptional regulator YhcF (GntR family)